MTSAKAHGARLVSLGTSLFLALALRTAPAGAQSSRPPEGEVAQVVDEVLSRIIPPDSSLSRVRVSDRGLYFDHARTLAAFGYRDTAAAVSRLRLRSSATPGTLALLEGCGQVVANPCQHLGWAAYAWLDLVSMSDSDLVVRLNVYWADRGTLPFQRGAPPSGRAYLVGFDMELHLARAADGRWRFTRIGPTLTSD